MKDMFESPRLRCRILGEEDVSAEYVAWLNDPRVNRFLETRHEAQTLAGCRAFVAKVAADPASHLFGMFLKTDGRHLGNIKLGPVNAVHASAQVSLFIGDPACWGQGLATEAVRGITAWGFRELGLAKIAAGCYDANLGSLRAFLKVGYQIEGYFREQAMLDGQRVGVFRIGILPKEFA